MATYQAPIVVGIFQIEIQAKHAVDAIRGAGFRYDQVGVAISSSSNATPDLQADLINLGVPLEQASYYDTAYKSGSVVVSIRPDGRDNEVRNILSSNGAYNYENRPNPSLATVPRQAESRPAPPDALDTIQDEKTQSVEAIQESSNDAN